MPNVRRGPPRWRVWPPSVEDGSATSHRTWPTRWLSWTDAGPIWPPGSAVSGTVAAALRAARTYLASIPPLELSGHTAVMTTLDAALAAWAPPPLPAGDQPVPAVVRQYLATRQGDVSIALFY